MDSDHSTRDPDAIAFEKAYPGVRAIKVEIGTRSFDFVAVAPTDALIQVGLVTQAMIDAIPPCGSGSFSPRARKPKNYAPLRTQLYRKKSGCDVQIRQWEWNDPAAVAAFCAKLGVPVPSRDEADDNSCAAALEGMRKAIAELQGVAGSRFLGSVVRAMEDLPERNRVSPGDLRLRERQIGRRQFLRRWATCGPVIFVDWASVRGAEMIARLS